MTRYNCTSPFNSLVCTNRDVTPCTVYAKENGHPFKGDQYLCPECIREIRSRTWEYSGVSENGEDITEWLSDYLEKRRMIRLFGPPIIRWLMQLVAGVAPQQPPALDEGHAQDRPQARPQARPQGNAQERGAAPEYGHMQGGYAPGEPTIPELLEDMRRAWWNDHSTPEHQVNRLQLPQQPQPQRRVMGGSPARVNGPDDDSWLR